MNSLTKHNVLSKSQIGFMPKQRTADHIYTLHTLIDKHIHQNKTKMYACFIDFQKAFNSILHDGSHPQFLLLISADFNYASLSSTFPAFTQYVKCHTRDKRTLDLMYDEHQGRIHRFTPPPTGLDYNLVHLSPDYIPMVHKQPPTKKYVWSWSEEASIALRDCFNTTDWDVLCEPYGDDIGSLTASWTTLISEKHCGHQEGTVFPQQ